MVYHLLLYNGLNSTLFKKIVDARYLFYTVITNFNLRLDDDLRNGKYKRYDENCYECGCYGNILRNETLAGIRYKENKKKWYNYLNTWPIKLSPILSALPSDEELVSETEHNPDTNPIRPLSNKEMGKLYSRKKELSSRTLFNLALRFHSTGVLEAANNLYKEIISRNESYDKIVRIRAKYNSASIELERDDDDGFKEVAELILSERYVAPNYDILLPYYQLPYDITSILLITSLYFYRNQSDCDLFFKVLEDLYNDDGCQLPLCAYNYAICKGEGLGCDKDFTSAITILHNVLNMEISDKFRALVYKRLGNFYYSSDNKVEARKMWEQSILFCSEECEKCVLRMNLTLMEEDPQKELSLYLQCIKHGCKTCPEASNYDNNKHRCPKALTWAAHLYLSGNAGVKDINKAEEFYKEAISQGYSPAARYMADRYLRKEIGDLNKDIDKVIALYEQDALQSGNTRSLHLAGKFLKKKNRTKALRYLSMAANNKYIPAEKELINCLNDKDLRGYWYVQSTIDGVTENLEHAKEYLCSRAERYIRCNQYDSAKECYQQLGTFDKTLSEERLSYLERITPDWYLKEKELDDDNEEIYIDDQDYSSDSWDAMTDGQYGDMPDNWGEDYSSMGRD